MEFFKVSSHLKLVSHLKDRNSNQNIRCTNETACFSEVEFILTSDEEIARTAILHTLHYLPVQPTLVLVFLQNTFVGDFPI